MKWNTVPPQPFETVSLLLENIVTSRDWVAEPRSALTPISIHMA